MAIIYVDSAVRFSVVIKDSAGTLVDPTTLQFTLINPAGIGTTYVYLTDSELIKDSTGNFHIDFIILFLYLFVFFCFRGRLEVEMEIYWHGRWSSRRYVCCERIMCPIGMVCGTTEAHTTVILLIILAMILLMMPGKEEPPKPPRGKVA